jgi:hypothetical protein
VVYVNEPRRRNDETSGARPAASAKRSLWEGCTILAPSAAGATLHWSAKTPIDRVREALQHLDKDRALPQAGDVFDDDFIDSYIELKMQERVP